MNNIPEGWRKVKFGDVVNRVKDEESDRSKWNTDKYVSGEHISSREIRIDDYGSIEEDEWVIGSAFKSKFKPGDVLYVTRRAYLRKGGMVDFEGICSDVTYVLRADENQLLQSLLPFIIQLEDFVKHTCNNAHGSTNPFLNWKDIAKYEFYLPPLEEQKKISEVLWSVEENIERATDLHHNKIIIKNKILKEIVNKSKDSDKICLKDIVDITMGQSPPSSAYNSEKKGLPFFQGKSDFGEKYPVIKTYTSEITKSSEPDSILFTVRAPVGELNYCNVKSCIGRGLASISPKKGHLLNYVYYVLEALKKDIVRISQGTTFEAISSNELKQFKVKPVSEEYEKKITKILDKIYFDLERCNKNTSVLKSLRNKLLNELLLGKLKLEDQNVQ